MQKKHKVVMLPTKGGKSVDCPMILTTDKVELRGLGVGMSFWNNKSWTGQHLYILSDEEIKEGDWFVSGNGKLWQYNSSNQTVPDLGSKKVIASTDKSIHGGDNPNVKISQHMPELSEGFIKKYIERYNAGNPLTEVMVEYDFNPTMGELQGLSNENIYKLKVRPNNTIITTAVEEPSFTKEDMLKAFQAGINWGVTYSTWFTPTIADDEAQFNKFIEENY